MPVLVDAEESGEPIASESERWALGEDEYALLVFVLERDETAGESLWFRVTRAGGGTYEGELVSPPSGIMRDRIDVGHCREFEPRHVWRTSDVFIHVRRAADDS